MSVVLLTGGAGYVGSHAALDLIDHGHSVVILDNLSTGLQSMIPADVPFYKGDFSDATLLGKIFRQHKIDSVMHFGALTNAPESLQKPLEYYRENAFKTLELLQFCGKNNVSRFLFSSSAAVYGSPERPFVNEETPCAPLTPYGGSKLMAERIIRDFVPMTSMRCGILRYFNVAGADLKRRAGQPNGNSPSVFSALCRVMLGIQESFTVHGNDYSTPDGTCMRDFIHVSDLATAHRMALECLPNQNEPLLLNCGYGHGYSILQLIQACETVTGKKLPHRIGARRDGDIEQIIASTVQIKSMLPWEPLYDNLELMIETSLDWECQKLGLQPMRAAARAS